MSPRASPRPALAPPARGERAGGGRMVVVDVHYPAEGGAVAAAVVCADRTGAAVVAEHLSRMPQAAPYEPGAFARRELPAVVAVLADVGPVGLLVVDGFATLDPAGRPGLGAWAHDRLRLPVIGIAKRPFRPATHALAVVRGGARRPLFVTAAGLPAAEAGAIVAAMAGRHRLPDAVRRADALARAAATPGRPPGRARR